MLCICYSNEIKVSLKPNNSVQLKMGNIVLNVVTKKNNF